MFFTPITSQSLTVGDVERNVLLRTLSQSALDRLAGDAKLVRFEAPQLLYAAEQDVCSVVFPIDAMFSVINHLRDGSMIEVVTIGSEGVLPAPPVLGGRRTMLNYSCEVGGSAVSLSVLVFERLLRINSAFQAATNHFVRWYITALAQRVACNQFHTILQRGARWLLRANDCGRDRIPLTHEHLAAILGSRRAGVSVALAKLQRTGCISYGTRYVTVVDRGRLERAACECYAMMRQRLTEA